MDWRSTRRNGADGVRPAAAFPGAILRSHSYPRAFLLCLLAASGLSCGGSSSGPSVTIISGVVIHAPRNVPVGNSVQFSATALDQNGQTVYGATFEWSSSNTAIATASSTGVVTGVAAGSARITARSGGMSDYVDITVGPILN
jgi:hypothetical protein